jgi:hypothetical protein
MSTINDIKQALPEPNEKIVYLADTVDDLQALDALSETK